MYTRATIPWLKLRKHFGQLGYQQIKLGHQIYIFIPIIYEVKIAIKKYKYEITNIYTIYNIKIIYVSPPDKKLRGCIPTSHLGIDTLGQN